MASTSRPGTGGKSSARAGAGVEQVLEVVRNQQELTVAKSLGERIERGPRVGLGNA